MGEIFSKLSVNGPHIPQRDEANLKRQEEIKHKITGYEARWQSIEAKNATWWSETSDNLKKEFRPDILEKLKTTNPLLFGGELPPFDTKFDITDANLTGGIVLNEKERRAVQDRIGRFNDGVGHARNDWNHLQKDLNNENFTPQELGQLQKTDASLLFQAELPSSYKKVHDNYQAEQAKKAKDAADLNRLRRQESLSTRMDEALGSQELPSSVALSSLPTGPSQNAHTIPSIATPPVKKFDIDQGLKSPHVLPSSLEPSPALTTSNFEKHLLPHTPLSPQASSGNFSNISMGEVTRVAVPLDTPLPSSPQNPPVKY